MSFWKARASKRKMGEGGQRRENMVSLFVAVALTWTAGFVDAVGFLRVGHIYTANMSGNSVALGIGIGSAHWSEALRRFWPVASYVVGMLACRLLVEIGARKSLRRVASLAFFVEILLLLPALLAGPRTTSGAWMQYAVIGVLSLAMGVQNGALTHFSSLTLNTGFVTGTLVKLSEQGARFLVWLYDRMRSGIVPLNTLLSESIRQKTFRLAVFLAFTWLSYAVGAVAGSLAQARWNFRSLLIAIVLLLLMIALDLHQPLAVQEERAQVGT